MVDTTAEGLEEMEALQAIFCDDFQELSADARFKHRYALTLVPHPGNDAENHSCVKLIVGLGPSYPTRPAYIKVEGVRGLSDDDLETLQGIVVQQTQRLLGQVMVFVVTDVVTEFLRNKNQPSMSFFEEMQLNQQEAREAEQAARDRESSETSKQETQLSDIISKHGIGIDWVEDVQEEEKRREERQKERNKKKRDREKRRKANKRASQLDELGEKEPHSEIGQLDTGLSNVGCSFTPQELILASLIRHDRVYGDVSSTRQVLTDLASAAPGVLELIANDDLFESSFQTANVLQNARTLLSSSSCPTTETAVEVPPQSPTPSPPTPQTATDGGVAFAANSTPHMKANKNPETAEDEEPAGELSSLVSQVRRVGGTVDTDSRTPMAPSRSLINPPSRPGTPMLSTSRYTTDFAELGTLGRGGFGRVVKVVNKLDNRVYAIKKIPSSDGDGNLNRRLLREVHALSRLHHKNVVRYYQAWLEGAPENKSKSKEMQVKNSSALEGDWGAEPSWTDTSVTGGILHSDSLFRSVVDPSERLRSNGPTTSVTNEDSSDGDDGVTSGEVDRNGCLYIQMEYCPNTLRSVLRDPEQNLEDDDIWRLFRQIVEGLVHIHSNQMIHRDLKPNNIFLDSCNDIKIGDFGLATDGNADLPSGSGSRTVPQESPGKTSMSPPSDSSDYDTSDDYETESDEDDDGQERTAGVGTYFYTSPEQHQEFYDERVDMYALGVIFFEMWYVFGSAHERVVVLSKLRECIDFPKGFEDLHPRQATIIRWLLQQDPSRRPTAAELLRSDLMPPKLEEEYLKDVLRFMRDPNALTTHPEVLESLFAQQQSSRAGLSSGYGMARVPMQTLCTEQATDVIRTVFKRHGAVPMGNDLLQLKSSYAGIPGVCEPDGKVSVIDKEGTLYDLRFNSRVAFAHMCATQAVQTSPVLRTYDISSVYLATAKQRRGHVQCDFDIVYHPSPRLIHMLPEAEVVRVVAEVLEEFYPKGCFSIRIGHAVIVDALLKAARVPPGVAPRVLATLATAFRVPYNQLGKQLRAIPELRPAVVDDLLSFSLTRGPGQEVMQRLEVVLSRYPSALTALGELKEVISHLEVLGVTSVLVDPTLTPFESWYTGILFQGVVREDRRALDIVALGGRYETLIRDFRRNSVLADEVQVGKSGDSSHHSHDHAVGVSVALDKIVDYTRRTSHIPDNASECDVLVCAVGAPFVQERMTLTQELWSEGVNAEMSFTTSPTIEEQMESAASLGCAYIVIMNKTSKERGTLKIRFLEGEKRPDLELPRRDAVSYLKSSVKSGLRNKSSNLFSKLDRWKDKQ